MTILRTPPSRTAVLLAAIAVILSFASAADAAVLCVKDPACPAGGVEKTSPQAAVAAANVSDGADTVRIGPGSYPVGSLAASTEMDIVGAGAGETELVAVDPGIAITMSGSATSSLADLKLRVTQPNSEGVRLKDGADATGVSVVAPDAATGVHGFLLEDPGSVLDGIEVDVPDGGTARGVRAVAGGRVEDSIIAAPIGIFGDITVRRVVVRASTGLKAFGSSINASNVLITRHPRPANGSFAGLVAMNGDGVNASIQASNLTIDGGGGGTGIEVFSNGSPSVTTGTATVTATGAIIRGVDRAIYRSAESLTEGTTVYIHYSSYNGATIEDSGGFGAVFEGSGNHPENPDPRFVNPAALDYRLRWDSPLIDVGRPSDLVSGENPDLAGNERVRDSDGNGSAIRDIGASEYQRLAPTAAFAVSPAATVLGAPTLFDASASADPDGDPLSFSWQFGDGASGSGAQASHVFGATGSYEASLTAGDPTGLSATASQTAQVTPAPDSGGGSGTGTASGSGGLSGPCANPITGTARGDVLKGLSLGELVRAGSGNDRVLGGAGDDCLQGQAGDDVLLGQAGADRLSGGAGSDRLVGGAGRTTVSGGAGNDRVDVANGVRDRVDCGRGRADTVKADRKDRLRGCERVRRG